MQNILWLVKMQVVNKINDFDKYLIRSFELSTKMKKTKQMFEYD